MLETRKTSQFETPFQSSADGDDNNDNSNNNDDIDKDDDDCNNNNNTTNNNNNNSDNNNSDNNNSDNNNSDNNNSDNVLLLWCKLSCEYASMPLTYKSKHKNKTYAYEMYIRIIFIDRFYVALLLFNTRP